MTLGQILREDLELSERLDALKYELSDFQSAWIGRLHALESTPHLSAPPLGAPAPAVGKEFLQTGSPETGVPTIKPDLTIGERGLRREAETWADKTIGVGIGKGIVMFNDVDGDVVSNLNGHCDTSVQSIRSAMVSHLLAFHRKHARVVWPTGETTGSLEQVMTYSKGWNAALAEFRRLNPHLKPHLDAAPRAGEGER